MNKEESDLFAKLITETYKNEQLQAKVNQLETNIKDAIELMFKMDWNEWGNGAEFKIQEILERGKE